MFDEGTELNCFKIGDKKDRIKLLSKPILNRENEINSGENIICISSHWGGGLGWREELKRKKDVKNRKIDMKRASPNASDQ